MFEHSLYEPEIVAVPQQEGDLFHDYEIRNWEFSPRLYRILAISGVANLLAILVVAQTSLLTMKGCDSPLVNRICQALDVVYVGSMVFGTERDTVEVAYDPTRIDDSEDITFVDVTGVPPPLSYPEGYFQLANPEQQAQMLDAFGNPITPIDDLAGIPVTPPTSGNSLFNTPPSFPTPNPNVVQGQLPSFDSGVASNPTTRKGSRGGKPKNPTLPAEDDNAKVDPSPEPTPISSDAVTSVEINKKPLADFADVVATKWAAKEVDLNQEFSLVLNAYVTADGKLDREKSKFDVAKQKGDQKMIDVGKLAMEALGDSGYLTYLKMLGVDQLTAVLVQDAENLTVTISSVQKTPERAKTLASQLGGVILVGKTVAKNPSDERTLLDGAKTTTDGKNFVLNFAIPKPIAHEMINRKLTEAQAKKQQAQPSGNTAARPANSNGK